MGGGPLAHEPPVVEVRHLTVSYGSVVAVDSVSFTLGFGEAVALVGPNGAGKSSLLRSMAGMESATGEVYVRGKECHHQDWGTHIAYVPQRASARWDLPLTVLDVTVAGRRALTRRWMRPSREDLDAAREALAQFELVALADRVIGTLSGGQAQRVLLARAMVQEPEVLLLDEPYAGLDIQSSELLSRTLRDMSASNVTVLCALHEIATARDTFPRAIALNQRIISDGPSREVLDDAGIARVFTSNHRADRSP